jgi:hypothetical protein
MDKILDKDTPRYIYWIYTLVKVPLSVLGVIALIFGYSVGEYDFKLEGWLLDKQEYYQKTNPR